MPIVVRNDYSPNYSPIYYSLDYVALFNSSHSHVWTIWQKKKNTRYLYLKIFLQQSMQIAKRVHKNADCSSNSRYFLLINNLRASHDAALLLALIINSGKPWAFYQNWHLRTDWYILLRFPLNDLNNNSGHISANQNSTAEYLWSSDFLFSDYRLKKHTFLIMNIRKSKRERERERKLSEN